MNIAIVDVESLFCDLVLDLLSSHTITPFYNAQSFLAVENKFDVVILDIDIPDMSGIEIAKRIKNDNIPIVFLSSHEEEVFHAFGKNIYKFIRKKDINTLPTVIDSLKEELEKESSLILLAPYEHLKV